MLNEQCYREFCVFILFKDTGTMKSLTIFYAPTLNDVGRRMHIKLVLTVGTKSYNGDYNDMYVRMFGFVSGE